MTARCPLRWAALTARSDRHNLDLEGSRAQHTRSRPRPVNGQSPMLTTVDLQATEGTTGWIDRGWSVDAPLGVGAAAIRWTYP
jgi:hypothetical protein